MLFEIGVLFKGSLVFWIIGFWGLGLDFVFLRNLKFWGVREMVGFSLFVLLGGCG